MQCSVVIPCHGGADLTRRCIQSLLDQRGSHQLEIILVDNARDPATAALAGLSPSIRVLPQAHNLGFGGGTNVGVRAATLPFLLLINNDTRAAPHLLTRLHAAWCRDDRIAFAAPVSNRVKGAAQIACGDRGATADGIAAVEAELAQAAGGMIQDVSTLTGLCLFTHRDVAQRLGGFDERFGRGNYEDDDLSLRARQLGCRLVVARDAFVHHEGHQTFRALGIDLAAELALRQAQYQAKWLDDPAGAAALQADAGDLGAAARLAPAAQRACPRWLDADWHLGRALAESPHPQRAIAPLQAFLRNCPHHSEAVVLLGVCLLAADQPRAAGQLWRWAREHCHFTPAQAADLLRRLGEHARGRGDLAEAIADFEAAVELQPDDAVLLNWLGVSLLEARRLPAAIAMLERAAAAGFALAFTNLGICHYQAGDPAAALRSFEAAAAHLPHDPTAQQNYQKMRAAVAPTAG